MGRRFPVVGLALAAAVASASCASIMQGTTQQVSVGSVGSLAREEGR